MSYIARLSKYLQHTFLPHHRKAIMLGVIGVIIVWLMVIYGLRGTFEQGQLDWGIDQGITQVFWGVVAILVILAVLSWPTIRKYFKSTRIDRFYFVLFSTGFFFIFLFVVTWQFWTHDQTINLYHRATELDYYFGREGWNLVVVDKILHFIVSFILVLFLLYAFPRKEWIIIAWAFVNLFELAEIMIIYNLYMLEQMGATLDSLLYEIGDATMDIIFNTVGILAGAYVATKIPYIRKKLR